MGKKNGTQKPKADLITCASSALTQKTTKLKVRLPSDVIRQFVDMPAPKSAIEKISKNELVKAIGVGDGTVLDCIISISIAKALGGDRNFIQMVLDKLEPRNQIIAREGEMSIGLDPQEDDRIVAKFREVLICESD